MRIKKLKIAKLSIIVFILIAVLCSFCGCRSKEKEEKIYETEYFRYTLKQYSSGKEYVVIKGLTELGKQQEYIVIPEEIDGIEVGVWNGYDQMPNLRAVYIGYEIDAINPEFLGWNSYGNPMIEGKRTYKTFYISSTHKKPANFGVGGYISTIAMEDYGKKVPHLEQAYTVANIQYLFNYATSPNEGVHFIDNTEVGEKVNVIPEIPERDGYIFTGWYTEEECINKIDLENYVKEDEEILYLYAGWQGK